MEAFTEILNVFERFIFCLCFQETPITGERSEHTAFSDSKESLVEDQTIFSEPPRKVHIVREVGKDGRFVQVILVFFSLFLTLNDLV